MTGGRNSLPSSRNILGAGARSEQALCTGIVETANVSGSGKGPMGWFKLEQVNVSYDHPFDASMEHSLNIDFVNQTEGPGARVAVELSTESAKKLVGAILASLSRGEAEAGKA